MDFYIEQFISNSSIVEVEKQEILSLIKKLIKLITNLKLKIEKIYNNHYKLEENV